MELLADWGTTNSTVGELVDILKSQKLLAAACVLLPDQVNLFKGDYDNPRYIMVAYNNIPRSASCPIFFLNFCYEMSILHVQ